MPRAQTTSSSTTPVVVIDNGSGLLKAGFAGEDDPSCLLSPASMGAQPFKNGIVADWEAMEACWDQAFAQLRVDSEECNLLVTAPLYDTKENKERLMQMLFETYGALGVWTSSPAVFELYAAGRENGVVLGTGHQMSYAVLVHEGLPDMRTAVRMRTAGEALTQHAATVLGGSSGAGALDWATAQKAKQALAVCAPDGASTEGVADGVFELPDGKKVKVDAKTRCALAEPLLDPTLVGEAAGGLAQLVADAIRLRDKDGVLESTEQGKDGTENWYKSVVLAGGSSSIAGLPQRLTRELRSKAPTPCEPAVCAPPERAHAAWVGASILGSLAVAGQMWISKAEYDENGPLIVHRCVRAVCSPPPLPPLVPCRSRPFFTPPTLCSTHRLPGSASERHPASIRVTEHRPPRTGHPFRGWYAGKRAAG